MGQNDDLNSKITDLSGKVDTLQAAIDADQASDAQVVSDLTAANDALKATVADLEAQLANGITPEQLQASIDSLNAVSAKVDAAKTDVAGPNA